MVGRYPRTDNVIRGDAMATPPTPPANLPQAGKDEWLRLAPTLFADGLLDERDTAAFATYAIYWSMIEDALEKLQAQGLTYPTEAGLQKRSPLVPILDLAIKGLLNVAGMFGLTPAARRRLNIVLKTPNEATDPMEQLLRHLK